MLSAIAIGWFAAQPAGSDAAALYGIYVSGVLQTTFADGRSVRYRDGAELERAMTAIYASNVAAASRRPGRTVARVGDGFL